MSVASIVRNLIEQLSEHVSELVYNVVVLQEQNADMPQTLIPATTQVVQTASMLVKVAHQLASVNYKNFENIAKEIRDAADAVTGASTTMALAIKSLASGQDKKGGWAGLTEACRVMAGKTIKLLQIVYAADLKRLFAVANAIHKGLGEMDLAKAGETPDDFAEWATALATKANQLATYLSARAKDEQSAVTKQKLEEYAMHLKSVARKLVDDVNELLEDPGNAQLKAACEATAKQLEKLIEEVGLFLLQTQTELPNFEETEITSLSEALKRRQFQLEDAARKEREAAEAAEAKRLAEALAARRAAAAQMALQQVDLVDAPDRTSELAHFVRRAQEALKRLQDMAAAGNAIGTAEAAAEFAKALKELKEAALAEAGKTPDAGRKAQILNSIKQLEQSLPTQLMIAKKLVDQPTTEDQMGMRRLGVNSDNWFAELLDATRTDDLLERAARADRAALLVAKAVSDQRTAEDRQVLGEDFARLNDKVLQIAKFQAQNAFTDKVRQAMQDAIKRLQMAAGNLANLGHFDDGADPASLNAKSVTDAATEYAAALQALQRQANAQAIGTLSSVVRDLDGLHRHALAENRTGIQAASLQMIKDGKAALEAARKVAALPGWSENPDEQTRLTNTIKEVDDRLKDEMQAVRQYMETGTASAQNSKRKEALQRVMICERPARDAIAYLEQILSGQVPEIEYLESPGNEAAITKSALELNDMATQIVDLAAIMKDQNTQPSKAAEATKELEKLLNGIQTESNQIIDALAENDPDERVVAKAAETVEYIRQLREAAQESPASMVGASHRLAGMVKELQSEIVKKIHSTTDADQGQLLEAQNRAIGELLTETIQVTKGILNDGLAAHKNGFESKTHLLKRAVQRTVAIVRPEDHDERVMRDTYSQMQLQLKSIAKAATEKDAKQVEATLREMDKVGKEYLRAAQKRKAKRKPGFVQHTEGDPLAEFKALAQKIGHPAREAATKGDKAAVGKFADVSVQMRTVAGGNNEDNVVDKIAAFQDVDETMGAIESAVERSDGERVTTLTKKLMGLLEKLPPIAEEERDPERKAELTAAVSDVHEKVRIAIQRATACIRDPAKDEVNLPLLGAAVDAARVPTARAIALLSPCEDRTVAEILRIAQAAVSAQGPKKAVAEIQRVIDTTGALAAKTKDSHKRRHVEQAVEQLQEKLETLTGPGEAATMLDVKESLEDLYTLVHTAAKTDVVVLAGAVKGAASEVDHDLKEAAKPGNALNKPAFDRKATNLHLKMVDLRDSALGVSAGTALPSLLLKDPVLGKNAPSELDGFLDIIEKSFTPAKPADQNVSDLLKSLEGKPKAEPKTFEEALERAAVDIAQAVQNSSQSTAAPEMVASTGIAADMARLAKAARSGNRQEMMLAAKSVSAHLTQLVNEINAVVERLGNKAPKETDRLLRGAIAMKNFGTQLRILTSVKAASIESDHDNDETLLSVTTGLGNVVTSSLQLIDTTKRVVLKERA